MSEQPKAETTAEMQLRLRWKWHWTVFLSRYPEVLDMPLKLEKEWLADLMARYTLEFYEDNDG